MSHDWGKHGRKQQEGLPHRTPAHVRVTQVVLLPRIISPSFFYFLFFYFLPAMTAAAHAWEPVDSIHKFLWLQRLASICSWHHSPRASLCIAPSLLQSRREFKVLFGNWAEIKLVFFKEKVKNFDAGREASSTISVFIALISLLFLPNSCFIQLVLVRCYCVLLCFSCVFLMHIFMPASSGWVSLESKPCFQLVSFSL